MFDTLESAQEEIIRLQGVVTELTTERDALSENNKTLTEDNKRLGTLNQKYFNQLCVQNSPQPGENDNEDEESVSCVELAKTMADNF